MGEPQLICLSIRLVPRKPSLAFDCFVCGFGLGSLLGTVLTHLLSRSIAAEGLERVSHTGIK